MIFDASVHIQIVNLVTSPLYTQNIGCRFSMEISWRRKQSEKLPECLVKAKRTENKHFWDLIPCRYYMLHAHSIFSFTSSMKGVKLHEEFCTGVYSKRCWKCVSDLVISGLALPLMLKPPSICFAGLSIVLLLQLTDIGLSLSLCLYFFLSVLPLYIGVSHSSNMKIMKIRCLWWHLKNLSKKRNCKTHSGPASMGYLTDLGLEKKSGFKCSDSGSDQLQSH